MALKKVQQILAADPNYGGSFEADRTASAGKAPAPASDAPQPQGHESSRAAEAPIPATPTSKDKVSGGAVAMPVKPARPPAQPSARAKRTTPAVSQARTPVSLRLRPLTTQIERIEATGLEPRKIMKAAWRKAVARCTVGATFVGPPGADRAPGARYLFESTLMVDTVALSRLTREHDRLGVEGPWWLIRGQLEPAFWAALDATLDELSEPDPT